MDLFRLPSVHRHFCLGRSNLTWPASPATVLGRTVIFDYICFFYNYCKGGYFLILVSLTKYNYELLQKTFLVGISTLDSHGVDKILQSTCIWTEAK